MASEDKKTRIVCECKELDEEGNVLRTFPMSSTSENLKRQRRGVSTWNEQLKVVSARMKEVLAGEKAPSGLQLKVAGKLKEEGKIENPSLENVRKAINEIQGVAAEPKANTPPKPKSVELEEDSDGEKESELVANNSREESRMQRQGGGGCGCTGGADMMMKGGAGCGMWPASGGKRKGRKTRKTRKARKGRKGTRKSKTSRR